MMKVVLFGATAEFTGRSWSEIGAKALAFWALRECRGINQLLESSPGVVAGFADGFVNRYMAARGWNGDCERVYREFLWEAFGVALPDDAIPAWTVELGHACAEALALDDGQRFSGLARLLEPPTLIPQAS